MFFPHFLKKKKKSEGATTKTTTQWRRRNFLYDILSERCLFQKSKDRENDDAHYCLDAN